MIGEGQQYEAMKDLAKELQILDRVKFTGFLSHLEICRIVGAADIAIAPYTDMVNDHFIGSPMKLFEYMASGIATIASDLGQIHEVIRPGENGLLVQAGNLVALVNAINKLAANPDLRAKLGEEARKEAILKYSWDNYITQLESIYSRVISGWSKKRPGGEWAD